MSRKHPLTRKQAQTLVDLIAAAFNATNADSTALRKWLDHNISDGEREQAYVTVVS